MKKTWFSKINWQTIIIVIIALVAFFTRFYKLDSIPAPWHMDEAGMAYDAFSLANYRVDRHMMHLPVYLPNYGDGQSALYAYLTAIFVVVFGDINPLVARLPAALFSVAAVLFGCLFVKKSLGNKAAILAAFLLTIFPYFIMQGRFGLDCNLFLGTSIISLYFTLIAITSQKKKFYALAGIAWGITLYSYALSWIVVPIFLLLLTIYLFCCKKINFWQLICLILPILAISWPLIVFCIIEIFDLPPVFSRFYYIPRLMNNRIDTFEIFNLTNFIKLPRLLFWVQDGEAYLRYPTFYWVSVPFALSGIYLSVKNFIQTCRQKKFSAHALILLFFVANLIAITLNNAHSNDTHHINSIFWPMAYFIIYAIVYFYRKIAKRIHKNVYITILIFVYILNFGVFSYQYFVIFPKEPTYTKSFMFSDSPHKVLNELNNYAREHNIENIVAEREIWLDIPRYIFYYLSEKVPPTEMDLTKDIMNEVRYGNVHFVFMPDRGTEHCIGASFCPTEINDEDIFIVNGIEKDYKSRLLDLGFDEIYSDDAYTILLMEKNFVASESGEVEALE